MCAPRGSGTCAVAQVHLDLRGGASLRSCRSASGVVGTCIVGRGKSIEGTALPDAPGMPKPGSMREALHCLLPCTACCSLLHEVRGANAHAGAENMNAHE